MNRFILEKIKFVLDEYLKTLRPADSVLSYFFRDNKNLGMKERKLIAEVYYGVIRNKLLYEEILQTRDVTKLILCNLALEQQIDDDTIILLADDFKHSKDQLKVKKASIKKKWIKYSIPEWIFNELLNMYPEGQIENILKALSEHSHLDIRINLIKNKDRESIINKLKVDFAINENRVKKTEFSPIGIRLPRGTQIQNKDYFKNGEIEVQDEGSQLLCYLLDANRKHMVADFCAGAGGKTLTIASLMSGSGRMYAFDINDKRLSNLKKRLKRSGLSNVATHLIKNENDLKIKRLKDKFDRVLVDAPCSGLGTIRRNPDLKWKHNIESIIEMQVKQQKILQSASRLCKVGGKLVYATCSLMKQENEDVVENFLESNPNYKLVNIQEVLNKHGIPIKMQKYFKIIPGEHDMDCFFAAIFERI